MGVNFLWYVLVGNTKYHEGNIHERDELRIALNMVTAQGEMATRQVVMKTTYL
jgi:hypothetical protein